MASAHRGELGAGAVTGAMRYPSRLSIAVWCMICAEPSQIIRSATKVMMPSPTQASHNSRSSRRVT